MAVDSALKADLPGDASWPMMGVVVPLANEEDNIDEFLRRVLVQINSRDKVFCVVDTVSRDRTRDRVEQYATRDPRVVLVWAPENQSVVDAYFRGFREALAAGCEWILEMDGGVSHLPEEIPKFISAMQTGVDYAGGSRFLPGGSHNSRYSRYLLSRGGTLLANLLLGTRMRDMTSGFECFNRRALSYVVSRGVRSRSHFFQTEIRYMMHFWKWLEVPITYSNPSKRVGPRSVLDAVQNLWRLYQRARREKRTKRR